LEISYSVLEGGENILGNFPNFTFTIGNGVMDEDPQFCDPNIFNYALNENSICLNASDNGEVIGAFDLTCSGTVSIQKDIFPLKFRLTQNYPNPFNPVTKIHFSLENDGFYMLNIFNINGQLINRLKSEEGQKGKEYSVIWDAKNLLGHKVPSGLYLYQLETVEGSLSKKMLLLK
jgi:hypothetical protein